MVLANCAALRLGLTVQLAPPQQSALHAQLDPICQPEIVFSAVLTQHLHPIACSVVLPQVHFSARYVHLITLWVRRVDYVRRVLQSFPFAKHAMESPQHVLHVMIPLIIFRWVPV